MADSSNASIYMELTERFFRGFPLYRLTTGHDHTPQSYHDQTEPSDRDNNEARAGGSRALSDQSSDSQIKMRRGVKRKRQTSGRSESRESKRRRLDHSSGSESNNEQLGSSVRDHNEAKAGGSRALSDQGSDSLIKMRRGVKRKRQTSGRSESRECKRRRLDLRSGCKSNDEQSGSSVRDHNEAKAGGSRALSDQGSDSLIKMRQGVKRKRQTSGRSESRESKRRRLHHRSGSESNNEQLGSSVRDHKEARAGASRASSDQSSGSQTEMKQVLKRKRQTCDRSGSKGWKRRKSDQRSPARPLRELPQDTLTPGPDHNPLLSIVACNTDYWSITTDVSGEVFEIAFYPTYNSPSETSTSKSSTDDKEHECSYLDSNSDNSPGGSMTSSDQSSDNQVKKRQGIKRKTNTSGRSESTERKSKRLDHHPGSDSNHDQTEAFVRDNNEASAQKSRAPSDHSSGSPIKIRRGVKRKRQISGRSKSRENKRRRLDHRSGRESNDDQPGSSVRDNNEARAGASRASSDQNSGSQIEMRQVLKRKRQTCDRSGSKGWKRRRSDQQSPVRPLRELHRDTLTPGPDHTPLLSIVACNTDYSSITTDVSGKVFEMAFYRTYNSPSETSTSKSSTDDEEHERSYLDSNSDKGPGGSMTSPDQSSDNQVKKRQGIKRKTNTSGRSESTEKKSKRLDHHPSSDSNHDQTEAFVRDNNEARARKSRTPSDQSSGSLIEMRQGLKRKRKTPDRSESRERKSRRLDHGSGSGSDSNSNSDPSSDSLSSGFSSVLLGETSRDEQESEVRASADQIGQDEFRTGGSRASSKQGSGNRVNMKQGLKTKRLASSRSQNRKTTKNTSDHCSDSHSDPSVRHNNEARARRSRATSEQSSGIQAEMRWGLKTTRKASSRSQSRERKSKRLDHRSDSDTYYDQPGSSHSNDDQSDPCVRDNSEFRAGRSRACSDQSSKTKASSRSQIRKSTKNRLGHHSDANDGCSDPSAGHNHQARVGRPRALSDQSSGSQVKTRYGLKTKGKASIRSQNEKSTKSRLDHRYDSHSNDDQSDPSVRDNSKFRAGRSKACSDQSSDTQVEKRRDLTSKTNTSSRSQTRKCTKNRLDYCSDSDSNDDRSEHSNREKSETKTYGDQISQDKSRQGIKIKISDLLDNQSKSTKSDHQSDSSIELLITEFSHMYISTPPAACGKTPMQPKLSNRENSEVTASGDQIKQDESRKRVKRKISELPDTQSKRTRSDHQSDSSIDSLILEFSRMCISTPPAACREIATKQSNIDDELPQLVNNSKVRAEESKAPFEQDSVSRAEARRGVKRNLKSTDRSESTEQKRRTNHHS